MKYNELHKILRKAGMIVLEEQRAGHPLWLNPQTGEKFTTSNHGMHEVATGTLKSILRSATHLPVPPPLLNKNQKVLIKLFNF